MNDSTRAQVASPAAVARIEPAASLAPQVELDVDDAHTLARTAVRRESPWPLFGLVLLLISYNFPNVPGLHEVMLWMAVTGGVWTLAGIPLLMFRAVQRSIALRGLDLDPALQKKAYRFAVKKRFSPRLLFGRQGPAIEEIQRELLLRFGPARGSPVDEEGA